MCFECCLQKNTKFISGVLASVSLSLLNFYEFMQLRQDGYSQAAFGIIIVWMASKFIAFLFNFRSFERQKIFFYFLCFLLQSEWYCICKSQKNQAIRMLTQLIVIALPSACINIYLLSLKDQSLHDPFYTAMIFTSFSILWINTFLYVMKYQKVFQGKMRVYSACQNFCTLYILAQCFIKSKIICIFLLIFNLSLATIDFGLSSTRRKKEEFFEDLAINFFSYITQINVYPFQTFQNFCFDTQLPKWENVLKLCAQSISLIILVLVKTQSFALVIQLDFSIYVCLFFCLPQYYLLAVNIYYKVTKQNTFQSQLIINENELVFNKKLYSLLKDRFVGDYKLQVIINLSQLNDKSKERFSQNLSQLQSFIKFASQSKLSSVIINVKDQQNSFSFFWRFQKANFKKDLQIQLSNNVMQDKLSYQLFQNLKMILIENIQQQIQLSLIQIELKQLKLLLLSGQFFSFNTYKIPEISDFENSKFNETIIHLASNNFQVLAYYKSISYFSPINPAFLLYDLYCQNV